jgi:hypothetical protein
MRRLAAAIGVLVCVSGWGAPVAPRSEDVGAAARAPAVGPGSVVVHSALGGFILGYDIDPDGSEGLLSEALTLPDGRHDIAVETFDQATGAIVAILRRESDSRNSYETLGVFAPHVGLTELDHASRLFVDKRAYALSAPLDANRFTGRWTPPFAAADDIITSAATNPGTSGAVFLGFRNDGSDFRSYVFASDVGANTFGPVLAVGDPVFDWNHSPVVALYSAANQAVLGSSKGCFDCPSVIGRVDLATGALTEFQGLGLGYINGIAVDSGTGIVCTTSEDDFSVEFYDLVKGTFRIVVLPNAFSQAQSGGAVAVDPVHKLFLVGQEFSSTALRGSSIQVFDEQGEYVESLNGFSLPASPAPMVLDTARRSGFVIVTPALNSLQSFTY